MSHPNPTEIFLKDYKPTPYLIKHAYLNFAIEKDHTVVKAVLQLYRNPLATDSDKTLILNGEELELKKILLDGKLLPTDRYQIDSDRLIIPGLPETCILETEVVIYPAKNKALSGLYQSKQTHCTQCEAEGFRRITYFLDRPDVMTYFTTSITADKTLYPILLSNGNLIDHKLLDGNRHFVLWEDPSLKSCYLFALVAGDLDLIEDNFTTQSGHDVLLQVYVEKGKVAQSQHAMASLKKAMRWDEQTYGREYDLDRYMIVAVSDFNMGAMENKGLNLFNDRYILANPQTATDDDYLAIESVIGHEYFHNWSGNRVTVRDWFQITLKEGLTIFRDQNFTADMNSPTVKRIKDVNLLRNYQFPQDASPMAHPIRPDSYIEVNNFYTVTVYNKGAEVIRMMETLLGKPTFRKAMDLYFTRNDGHAVTSEDFVKAMEDASGMDLTQFRRWYHQAGTPVVKVTSLYDAANQTFTLNFHQTCPPTPQQPHKEAFHIPIRLALLNQRGESMPLMIDTLSLKEATNDYVFSLTQTEQKIVFKNVSEPPIPSLLRNFSAPVKLDYPYTDGELIFLMSHDTDGFNAWDAGQEYVTRIMIEMIKTYNQEKVLVIPSLFLDALRTLLNSEHSDLMFLAEIFTLPTESYVLERVPMGDVGLIYLIRKALRQELATHLKDDFLRQYHKNHHVQYDVTQKALGQRRFKNLCLNYLMLLEEQDIIDLAMKQFKESTNLTDSLAVLSSLTHIECPERKQAFDDFYSRYQHEHLVVDKWFAMQAISTLPTTFEAIQRLMQHPAFELENPNRTRALLGTFSQQNIWCFHDQSGKPYAFLAEQIQSIDKFNPQLAARLIEPLIHWKRYDLTRQSLMKKQLEHLATIKNLSTDVYEIVTKCLEY